MPENVTPRYMAVAASPRPDGGGGHPWAAFICFHLISALAMISLLATTPEPSGKVALIYPPFVTADEAFLRAASTGARLIRQGNVGWIVVVAPATDDRSFSSKARASGALALLNPVIAGDCSVAPSSSKGASHKRSP